MEDMCGASDVSSLTFGGWELKWRVAVDKAAAVLVAVVRGAAVDVIDPRADEKDAKRKKASRSALMKPLP